MRRLQAILLLSLVSMTALGVESDSGNIVGYMSVTIRNGDNICLLPSPVGGRKQCLSECLRSLLAGDRVLVEDGAGNECWAEVYDDGEMKHASLEGSDEDVDQWLMPTVGGSQVLRVRRTVDEETKVTIAGEFDQGVPIHIPEYHAEFSLEKIKLSPSTVKSLQVTPTAVVPPGLQKFISKQFELVQKDGSRIKVEINPESRQFVYAGTKKPVAILVQEIAALSEIKDEAVPLAEKATGNDLSKVSSEVSTGARKYSMKTAIREGLVGAAWNDEHPWQSAFVLFLVVTVPLLGSKVLDFSGRCLARGVKRRLARRAEAKRFRHLRPVCVVDLDRAD